MYTPTPTIPPITICNSIFEIKDNTNTSNKKINKERINIGQTSLICFQNPKSISSFV